MNAPTATAKFVAVNHYGASVVPNRVSWLVEAKVDGCDEVLRCCNSTHGHRTKQAAKDCFVKAWNRYRKAAA